MDYNLAMGDKQTPRANPKEKGNINPITSILESVEEIPTILETIQAEKFVKERNGMKMVCLLPFPGLDPSNFAPICVHSL